MCLGCARMVPFDSVAKFELEDKAVKGRGYRVFWVSAYLNYILLHFRQMY